MDRIETYVGQSVLEWCFSKPDQNKMVAMGKIIASLFGTGTIVSGLACAQQSVATMFVNIAPGEIYQQEQLEATACGTLPADTTHQISKQGIALDAVTVPNSATGITAFVAPVSSGQSINYLIQVAYADLDVSIDPTTGLGPVVLPFYNAANSQSPWQGPGGLGATSNTFRKGTVNLQIKAGIAAATGSQATPAPDSGFVGLSVVTVAFGQTTVTNSNIATYPGAPVLPASLLNMAQTGVLKYGIDVGSVNTIQAVYPIPPTALQDNQPFWVKPKVTSTGAVTFTPNPGVIAASPVVGAAQAALQGGEFVANGRALLIWRADITSYVLIECTGAALQIGTGTATQHAATVGQVQTGSLGTATAGGTANAITAAFPAAPIAYATGQPFTIIAAAANTGAMTAILTLGGTAQASVPIVKGNNQPLVAGDNPSAGYPGEYNYSPAYGALVMQNPATGVTTVTTATDPTFADNSTKQASTGWVRGAMSAIAIAAGFGAVFGPNGYIKFPSWLGSLIIQWGTFSSTASADAAITFPISFTSAAYSVSVSSQNAGGGGFATIAGSPGITLSGFSAGTWINNTTRVATPGYYIAIGK